MFQQGATPNWQVDAPELIHEAFAYKYCSTASARQAATGCLRYNNVNMAIYG